MYDLRGKGNLEPDDVRFWIKRSYYNLNPMTDSQKAEFYQVICGCEYEWFSIH